MQKLQNIILWHKNTPAVTYTDKKFLRVKEHFFMNLNREFHFCDSTVKG